MADQHNSIGTGRQEVLQPLYTLDIQMVSRLIKEQHIRTTEQELRQLDTHTPAAGEFGSRTVKVFPAKAQSQQGTFYFRLKIGSTHHQEAVVFVCKAVYQLVVFFGFIVGAVGKLLIHPFKVCLKFENMLKGEFCFLHHRADIRKDHDLRQIADCYIFGDGYHSAGRCLQTCQYFQHSRFARTILADQSDAVFFIDNIADIRKERCRIKFY